MNKIEWLLLEATVVVNIAVCDYLWEEENKAMFWVVVVIFCSVYLALIVWNKDKIISKSITSWQKLRKRVGKWLYLRERP